MQRRRPERDRLVRGSLTSSSVSTTIGIPSPIDTQVRAGVARTARTASSSTTNVNSDNAARPTGESSMNGKSSTPSNWTTSRTADGCRHHGVVLRAGTAAVT